MRHVLGAIVSCAFAIPGFAHAQGLASITDQRLSGANVTTEEVRNIGHSQVTAFEARYTCGGRLALAYHFDSLLNYGTDRPIAAGRSFTFSLPQSIASCQGGVIAVLFADGHSEGDGAVLEDIRQKRLGALSELQLILSSTGSVGTSFDVGGTVRALTERVTTVSANRSLSSSEKQGRMFILNTMADLFTKQMVIGVPSDQTPTRGPSVMTVANTRTIPIEAAHALVMHQRVQEWVDSFSSPTQGFKP